MNDDIMNIHPILEKASYMSDNSRPRPTHVIKRDRLVAVILATTGPQPLSQILERASAHLQSVGDLTPIKSDDVYRSLCRLRLQGGVSKTSVGTRTPNWDLTPEGAAFAAQVQVEGLDAVPTQPPVVVEPVPAPPQPEPAPV